ncbi:response regulator [Psychromonas ossibalaenae]|uniref:response regulator n=1 Tax=Psychromonas ossibalaenae TaxID=444922 RepID=UPI00037A384F|nr:response regulator [Psychromonas ossibalaenae]
MAKTIMVVDDSASIRQVVSLTLKGAGFEVITANDGQDALAKLQANKTKINLIITDVNMPKMDGITLVKEAKKLPAYKFTPMMMLTTEASDSKKQQGRGAGAKAWLVKPFQPPMLLTAVSKLVLP